ncbi:hypothetical protein RchiOBHm_Chr4g0439671 [Rosa chinensis]|uniref:Uncharacterized protein n=1 Tax=Rosa chinensis TaxID=74649 RepID=A0A2P6R2W6_ROSCH|nr:hypothetical protein RchiOBHm_Chr4g0439671 [Rosa chinensis]
MSVSTDSDTNDAKKIGAEEDFENFLGCLKDTNMQAQGVDPKRGWGFRGVHKWQPPDQQQLDDDDTSEELMYSNTSLCSKVLLMKYVNMQVWIKHQLL